MTLHHSTRRRRAKSAIVSWGKLLFPRFTLRALTTSGVLNRAVLNWLSQPIRGAWPDRQKLVTQKLDTHPAHQEKSLRWMREKKKKGSSRRSVSGERSRQPGLLEVDRFQYGTPPCLMTRKLVRPTANKDTLTKARHHSIFRNTSG